MPERSPPSEVASFVDFLNVDLEVSGAKDHPALIQAFGSAVFVVCNVEGLLSLEVSDGPDAELLTKLEKFVVLLSGMSDDVRTIWDAANRRVLNIGIQSGLRPHASEWHVPAILLSELAALSVDLVITVYGAETIHQEP